MLNLDITGRGFIFNANNNGIDIPFNEWVNTNDCIYYLPLSTLVDNGFASINGNKCVVPFESVYYIDREDQELLGLPPYYDMALRLRSEGILNTPEFSYVLEYMTKVPDGEIINCVRIGNVIYIESQKYLLSRSQYTLAMEVDYFNIKLAINKTPDQNFRDFANIKQLAIESGCELDSYLQNENVYVPEKIKIDIAKDETGYTIDPSLPIEENSTFQQTFDRIRKIKDVYPVARENGERIRVVLNEEQRENLEVIKKGKGRHKSYEEIKDIIEHPTEYFNPESFDLSEFYSDRVIEIGIYKPKFYPFISPYKSCWIVGASIESRMNGTTKIVVKTQEELSALNRQIEKSEANNSSFVAYQNCEISIEDAKALSQIATQQLSQPQKPISINKDALGREVLIIEENAENLGFTTEDKQIAPVDSYTLFRNSFLREEFALKKHQEEGIAWFQHLYKNNASGCLMADDMGLGKTLQVLYFIDWHSRIYEDHKPYLIVAPISLLENWENEYNRFFNAPRLNITRISSRDIPRKFDRASVEKMQGLDIILTNYESLRNCQLNFCAVEFDIVALDEAQKIKAPGTLVTNAAKALKSKFKIAMTGTPVENTLLDLWCIMDFCVPGYLGNAKTFAAKYQNPLKNSDVDIEALGNEIHSRLGIYLMRRLKADAAKDLPNKIEQKKHVNMPYVQESLYRNIVDDYVANQEEKQVLNTIQDLKSVSEHPYLYDETLQFHETDELIETSARLQATVKFLDDIKQKGEKAIVFAERKHSQKMLQRICHERYGIITKIINGDTPTASSTRANSKQSRQSAIDDFQSADGFNVIIMSPVAAGMGLNVTAANHVIHFSRHWNPAKENQATDRAYRIGQTKDVYVYYPMAISPNFKAFDETLDELLSRKNTLASSTIFPTERIEVNQDELYNALLVRS